MSVLETIVKVIQAKAIQRNFTSTKIVYMVDL